MNKQKIIEESLMVKYLLGELTEEAELNFENEFFGEDHHVQELEAVRDDLIDRYITGKLSEPEREAFRNNFLSSPYHWEKFKFAQSLIATLPKHSIPASALIAGVEQASLWQFIPNFFRNNYRNMAMAAAVLLMVVGSYLWFRTATAPPSTSEETNNLLLSDAKPENRNGLNQDPVPSPAASNDQIQPRNRNQYPRSGKDSPTPPVIKPRTSKPSNTVVAFVLTPSIRSGEEAKPLEIYKSTASVELLVTQPPAGYRDYCVVLSTVEGQEVWRRNFKVKNNDQHKQHIKVTVPSKIINNQDYILDLSGVNLAGESESVGKYSFRVVRSR